VGSRQRSIWDKFSKKIIFVRVNLPLAGLEQAEKGNMLNLKNRLTKRKEFGYIYKNGSKAYNNYMTLVFIPTKLHVARFGFAISKKIGKAYVRNKLKRQMREIVRLNLEMFNNNFNYVFVPRPEIINLNFLQIKESVFDLIKRAKLIK
jgi:ribonuclease P protein component